MTRAKAIPHNYGYGLPHWPYLTVFEVIIIYQTAATAYKADTPFPSSTRSSHTHNGTYAYKAPTHSSPPPPQNYNNTPHISPTTHNAHPLPISFPTPIWLLQEVPYSHYRSFLITTGVIRRSCGQGRCYVSIRRGSAWIRGVRWSIGLRFSRCVGRFSVFVSFIVLAVGVCWSFTQ